MSDCPHCAVLRQVIADTEAAALEDRLAKDAALRQAVSERKRADRIEAKLSTQLREAEEAKVIRACLNVWKEHCWLGKARQPSLDLAGARAGRVREFLALENVTAEDICDGFRGLGLLPYEGPYGKRSATLNPGFTRKADVQSLLRTVRTAGTSKACPDEARLERFRDYYRRTQSSPATRLEEKWQAASAVADELFVLMLRAQGKEEAAAIIDETHRAGHLFVIEGGKAA